MLALRADDGEQLYMGETIMADSEASGNNFFFSGDLVRGDKELCFSSASLFEVTGASHWEYQVWRIKWEIWLARSELVGSCLF